MNGLVYEWYQTWQPSQQFTVLAVGSIVTVVVVGSCLGYWLRREQTAADTRTEAEFAPTLTWARDHDRLWPVSREQRTDRRRLWSEENRQATRRTADGRHRRPEPAGLPPGSPEDAVDQAFAAAFNAPLPAVAPDVTSTAVGKAAVAQDVEDVIAAVNAVCSITPMEAAANRVETALIPAVTSGDPSQ
ncbi:hypothetical protein ACIBCR_14750 [Micromonospora echinospora]|uniref:hypothetical protein n=1 Tax=Micromonospora echinospora TaxID=1877 RepID=UPI0037AB7F01